MATDYCNQEKEHFRKLQSESYSFCNGHYSNLAQVYDTGIALFSNALGFIIYFGILLKLNAIFVIFLSATPFVSYFLNKKVIRWAAESNKEKIGYQQKTNYINRISGDIKSAKDICLYGMYDWFDKIYRANISGLTKWYRCYTAKIFKTSICDGGLSLLREGIAYAYLLYLVLNNRISVADFVLYFGVITGFTVWLNGILGQINSLNRISLSVNYLRAYLEYPESYKREGGIEPADTGLLPKTIELINVSYCYEGSDADTISNISLKIDPAEHLAIVGLNGAGKTTLVKLICGLCDPTEGEILYDGIDIKEYNRNSYYKLFSAVFQQFSILPVTLEEIVAESLPEGINTGKVEACLKQSGLWDKICTLPEGVKSKYGKILYDDGIEFSGGEIQKLLLSRALYKAAPVMVLDEPTAALDPIAESELYETYNTIMMDKSTIFISHRLASTRFCSRILLIENGTICEEGTHASLLLKKGKYYDLFEKQAKYYREKCEK
jgi:ATP-binding cassette subfamily B protein